MIPLELQGHTVSHLKVLRYNKDESRGLSCGCTSSICQDVMKSENLLHKRGFVDSLLQTTVTLCTLGRHVNAVKLFFAHYKFWRNDDHGEHNYSVAIFIYGSNSPN